jgi:hypothetical protein
MHTKHATLPRQKPPFASTPRSTVMPALTQPASNGGLRASSRTSRRGRPAAGGGLPLRGTAPRPAQARTCLPSEAGVARQGKGPVSFLLAFCLPRTICDASEGCLFPRVPASPLARPRSGGSPRLRAPVQATQMDSGLCQHVLPARRASTATPWHLLLSEQRSERDVHTGNKDPRFRLLRRTTPVVRVDISSRPICQAPFTPPLFPCSLQERGGLISLLVRVLLSLATPSC